MWDLMAYIGIGCTCSSLFAVGFFGLAYLINKNRNVYDGNSVYRAELDMFLEND